MPAIVLWIVCVLMLAAPGAHAQTSGTITGVVYLVDGSLAADATVVARNTATGLTRTATSAADGRYVIAGLSAGDYELQTTLPGFHTSHGAVHVSPDERVTFPIVLDISVEDPGVSVLGTAVNVQTPELSFLVGAEAIGALPLNGRNYTDLTLLQPGVLSYPSRDGGSVVAHGLGMSVNGQDYRSNVYLLDGTLLNDFTNGPAGSAAGTTLGTESVSEFRVETNAYGAEFGRSYGGQINVLTKSGGNTLSGSAYEFHRNDALDAPNYFDVAGKPPFTRNQFGATAGGPIRADRLFYFAAYEGLRERLGRTITSFVPDDNARAGLLPDGPVTINAAVRPYLDAMPRAGGAAIGGGLAPYTFGFNQTLDEAFLQGRIDVQPGPSRQFFVRYTYDDGDQRLPTDYPAFPRSFLSTNQFLTAEYRNVRSERLLQSARLGVSRTRIGQHVESLLDPALPPFVPARGLVGDIDVGGMQRFGPQSSADVRLSQNVYSGQYDVTHTRGRHLIKAGALVEHYRDFETNPTFSLGIYTFANVRAFLENRATRFVGLPAEGDIRRDWPWTLFGGYVQDSYQLTPRFTIDAGLRDEWTTMPIDTGGRDSALVHLSDAAPTVGRLFDRPSRANLSPRVGFAWDISERVVPSPVAASLRGGYGLYYGTTTQQNLIVTVTNPPATPRDVIPNPSFPSPPFERGIGNTIRPMQWDITAPRLHVWNVSLQDSMRGGFVATVAYAGSRGTHLLRDRDVNIPTPSVGPDGRPFFAAGLPRPNAAWGTIELKSSDGDSWYRAFIVELRRTFRDGFSFQASYTRSRSTDTTQASTFFSDATNGTTVAFPEVIAGYNKGPSDWDTPNNLVVNVVWDVPFARRLAGSAKALLDGWQFAGIATGRSGQPLTVFVQNNWSRSLWSPSIAPTSGLDRPDLAAGRTPSSAVIGRPDQWFDPSAFVLQPQGTMGNSPRGAFRGPNLRTVDLAAVKRAALLRRARLELRIEVFNVFNRANFGNPTLVAFAGAAAGEAPLASFGRIRSTITSARQTQLGLRVTF